MHWKLRVWIVWDRNWDLTCANNSLIQPIHLLVPNFTPHVWIGDDFCQRMSCYNPLSNTELEDPLDTCRWFLYLREMRLPECFFQCWAQWLPKHRQHLVVGHVPRAVFITSLTCCVFFAFGRAPWCFLILSESMWITWYHIISDLLDISPT